MMRSPSPDLKAIISAATTTNQATPRLILMPTMICGRAAGITTWRNSASPETPKFSAARMYWRSMVWTPAVVSSAMGKKEERKIRKIGARFPTPNQMMARGIHAIGEIGRRICVNGLRATKSPLNHPIKMPSGMAKAAANKYPVPTLKRDAATCSSSVPCCASSAIPRTTFQGEGMMIVPLAATAVHHSAIRKLTRATGGRIFVLRTTPFLLSLTHRLVSYSEELGDAPAKPRPTDAGRRLDNDRQATGFVERTGKIELGRNPRRDAVRLLRH